MRKILFTLLLASTAALAEDGRQLAKLPPAAQEALRAEMRDNLIAVNEVLTLLAAGQVLEAGEVAENKLGLSAMGRHRDLPMDARPGMHMPAAMHRIGLDGHKAASAFAEIAKSGNREQALTYLPKVTANCVTCHASYRIR